MKTDEKNGKSVKKITRIINILSVSWLIILSVGVFFLRIKTNIFPVLLYCCMGVLYIGGLIVFQKVIEHSSLKEEFEEANRECEKEEATKTLSDEKPDLRSLAAMALLAFIIAIFDTIGIVRTMIATHSQGQPIQEYLPQCADSLTILTCCIFIAVILVNVSRKRIFDRRNSICIYGVGVTVIFSYLLQNHLWGDTIMTNLNTGVFYSLLGVLILFFGRLYDIAVKMKKEQDLTI